MPDRIVTTRMQAANGDWVEVEVKELGSWNGPEVLRRLALRVSYVETGLSVPSEVRTEIEQRLNADL